MSDYVARSEESVKRVVRELEGELAEVRGWLEREAHADLRTGFAGRIEELEAERRRLEVMVRR